MRKSDRKYPKKALLWTPKENDQLENLEKDGLKEYNGR